MAQTYTPPGSRANAAILALYVKVGACLLGIGADVGRITTANGLQEGTLLVDDLLGADRLVVIATLLELLALVVALALVLRWALVVRGNRGVLGGAPPRLGVLTAAWIAVAVATVAVLVSWTLLGEADDVADRRRIDGLRAGATALSAVAAGLVIAAVSRVTRRQEERAAAVDPPRAAAPVAAAEEGTSEGGLRVVSEEQARRPEADA
ncbi:MAG: hypothetical protein JWO90_2644 [Solirubrobacterales bacterium]|nr:hypothetical protein [Solirubrobacterales bacterium]